MSGLCACGCGLPRPGTFDHRTGAPIRFRHAHAGRIRFPLAEVERESTLREIADGTGWTSVYLGPDGARTKAALSTALAVLRASPTLRRVVAEIERGARTLDDIDAQ